LLTENLKLGGSRYSNVSETEFFRQKSAWHHYRLVRAANSPHLITPLIFRWYGKILRKGSSLPAIALPFAFLFTGPGFAPENERVHGRERAAESAQ
jgi:hypothetical protein